MSSTFFTEVPHDVWVNINSVDFIWPNLNLKFLQILMASVLISYVDFFVELMNARNSQVKLKDNHSIFSISRSLGQLFCILGWIVLYLTRIGPDMTFLQRISYSGQ